MQFLVLGEPAFLPEHLVTPLLITCKYSSIRVMLFVVEPQGVVVSKVLVTLSTVERCLGHVLSPDVSPQPLGVVALLFTYGAILFMGLHSPQDKLIFCVLHVPAEVNPCSFHPPAEDIMLVLSFFYNLLRNGDLLNCLSFSSSWLRKGNVLPFPFRVVPHQILLRVDFGVLLCQVKLL